MPLSVFIKINNITHDIAGLKDYLNNPVRQHLLVKDLPADIRGELCKRRKYIFTICEQVTRLCWLGLIQFGDKKFRDKDQFFIYVNTRSELLDTTSSAAGYHKIEDKSYPSTKYEFTSLQAVEKYWYEMWNICINTCLGERSAVEGKDILLEDLSRKTEMVAAMKAHSVEAAPHYDNGFVPGDRKGAAGIDSAFFAHLKRNWNWTTNHKNLDRLKKIETKTKVTKKKSPVKATVSTKQPKPVSPVKVKTEVNISSNRQVLKL